MIDERANRNPCEELGNTSGMVNVIMSEQDEIDFRYASIFCSHNDTVRVTSRIARPARIDE